ncbi:MAG: hypothetical protein ACI9QN_001550 [Arcticibacterium sp.]|jgi:hypothetical protein
MPVPFDIILTSKSGLKKTIHQSSEGRKGDKELTEVAIENFRDLTSVRIEGGILWMLI